MTQPSKRTPSYFRGALVAGNLTLVALLLFASLFYDNWTNTLDTNGRWESSKVKLGRGVQGAVYFMVTRVALADNHLNLGAWEGYQELFFKEALQPAEIALQFRLSDTSRLAVFFHRGAGRRCGLRLSNDPAHPSMWFEADEEGRFLEREPLPIQPQPGKWHRLELRRDSLRGLVLQLDGRETAARENACPMNAIGFRGCARAVWVDEIEARDPQGNLLMRESFTRRVHYPVRVGVWGLILVVFNLALWGMRHRKGPLYLFLLLTFFGALGALAVWLFQESYYEYRYPARPIEVALHERKAHKYPNPIEYEEAVRAKVAALPAGRQEGLFRILFIGTSQTWGAGASTPEKTWVRRVERGLNARCPHRRFECINTGIPGYHADTLFKLYQLDWQRLEPDAMVINLSNNDNDMERFQANLRNFLHVNRRRGIPTFFLLEANHDDNPRIQLRHRAMQEVIDSENVPALDMHHYLLQKSDEGFLWWDFVHLADFGQRLLAERLLEFLLPHLCPESDAPPPLATPPRLSGRVEPPNVGS
ncbi:MAG: hypothetical protein D6765_07775 [Bacteroidetes bacterium]|nr:MAG: hypothetical protein D6765_07775 [Bacteroidota bacterium]